jgi:hypothetical protein
MSTGPTYLSRGNLADEQIRATRRSDRWAGAANPAPGEEPLVNHDTQK